VINYVMVGSNKFEKATAFYEALMSEMGAERVYATDRNVGWGWGIGTSMFILCKPFDGKAASTGNGCMTAFDVATPEMVDRLHAKVLSMGGSSEGDPGPRGEHLYVGYWRDLDGNKFNFICYRKPAQA
jgi:catechol 2,3-dioxygenase-like lactoylglutathione lyase family enzyme